MPLRRPAVLVLPLLLGLTWAVYAATGGFGFVLYDDPDVVQRNPHVQGGLSTADARWAVTGFAVGHWEPLTWWSLQADVSAWGGRPGPMHVENVLLHAAGSMVLYGLLASATGAAWRSAVVAALFAVHPMHVESVAWITERRDVLSTPPLLAAVWAYVRYARAAGRSRWAWYVAMLVLYAVSLCAKATGMTLPAVLLLVDVWPLGRTAAWSRRVAEKVPVAVVAAPVAALAVAAQRAAGAASSLAGLPLDRRLANAAVTAVVYVVKLAVPTDLAVHYPHPGSRPAASVVAAVGLLALATAFAWRARRRRPYLLVGWLWFVVTLSPTSGLLQSGPQAMADRYSYLPSVGLFAAVVWAAPGQAWAAGVAAAAVLALTAAAHRQVAYWHDTETLFRHDLDVVGENAVADIVLATAAHDRHDDRAAGSLFRRAVAVAPSDAIAQTNLSGFLLGQGDGFGAEAAAAVAVRSAPASGRARVAHARALSTLPGRRAEAVAELRAALAIAPSDGDARAGLADLLARPPEATP